MIRIEGPRGSGKTYELIKYAYENDAVIITYLKRMAQHIYFMAKDLGMPVTVITYTDYVQHPYLDWAKENKKIVIDEIEIFLKQLLFFGNVKAYTSNTDEYEKVMTLEKLS